LVSVLRVVTQVPYLMKGWAGIFKEIE